MKSSMICQQFRCHFSSDLESVVHAPGRVNLIDEHTDYNEGFILPVAIDKYVSIAARSRTDRRGVLNAMDFGRNCEFSLDDIQPGQNSGAWGNYPKGVAYFLQRADHPIAGMEAAISGDVPIGVGLASSAAIEVASALVFLNVGASHAPEVDESELAVLCQRAENQFVGVNCGIMD